MLTEIEKARRSRTQMLKKARQYQISTYKNKFVAPVFQRMIRAETATRPEEYSLAIVEGRPRKRLRKFGQCVCVTCGKVGPWSGGLGGMHTGHFLASRANSILFEEDNVAPQCSRCNRYEGGAPQLFRAWMLAARGEEVVKHLEELKRTTVRFTIEDLVDKRIEFQRRLKAALTRLEAPDSASGSGHGE